MLTENAIVGEKEKYLEQGFREFISKPIIPQQLEKVIKKHVNCDTINQSKTEDHSIVFPEIDGVDWDYAKAFFPYEELLHATSFEFAKSLKEEVVILDKYFHGIQDEMICDKYIIKIHSIKSLARNVGAIRISELAELIEFHAKEAEFVTIRVMHPYLIKDLN